MTPRRSYRLGLAVACVTPLLIAWTTVVRDDGNGLGYLLPILAAGVGAFAAWFEAAGMARAMLGVAVMQMLGAVAIATAPVTAATPGGVRQALVAGGGYAALWLLAAALFRRARHDASKMN